MARTAAEILVDNVHAWGVEVVFGLPGDGLPGPQRLHDPVDTEGAHQPSEEQLIVSDTVRELV